MLTIALTGGIACGKSTVSGMLSDLGASVIDADQISRSLTAPGGLALPAIRAAFGEGVFNADGTLSARSQKILNNTPMNRFGEPDDLTGTLLWLASDEASGFVTGVVVPVDGGFNAYSGV